MINRDKMVTEIKTLNKFYDVIRSKKDEPLMETMIDFCETNDIPVEELGFLISEDSYLKTFVESSLKKSGNIRSSRKTGLAQDF